MTKTYVADTIPTIDAIPEPPDQLHVQIKRLADRLGLAYPPYGKPERLVIPALYKLLDRIESLEKSLTDDHR